ncbi:hypothetical protein [uncultured Pseudoalteromonas sp.]|uniref:hypothetical protein n=1 Tax=uncultured Pseudoalteromonas sp. TaxID=114053 RepID=UPI0025908342|nr:hypothetical protein [uncultured Pseudoalteromonas sp.]
MIKWHELNKYQKAAFWCLIAIVGWFSPEIALLFHFGGIEVVFAFLAMYSLPIIRVVRSYLQKIREKLLLAYVSFQKSASGKTNVFLMQTVFCCIAVALTGSFSFAMVFLMPGMMLNNMLI